MNKLYKSLVALVCGLVLATASVAISNADSTSSNVVYSANGCSVSVPGGIGTGSKYWVNNGSSMTAQFKVSGKSSCSQTMTFASWEAPNSTFKPISEQTLYAHTTGTYGVGVHTITVTIPACYYQADLLIGSSPTASDGSANYAWGQVVGNLEAGSQQCTQPTPPVTPTTPSTPATPAASEPTALVNTGPGDVIGLFVATTIGGAIAHRLYSRRRLARG